MAIVTIYNQKGGVGKTTTVLNLAASLTKRGNSPYAIDLDPQANLTGILGVSGISGHHTVLSLFENNRSLRDLVQNTRSGIGLIPAHMQLAKADVMFGKGYDVVNRLNNALRNENFRGEGRTVLIDCNPLIGVLSLNAIFAADCVIVPVSADHLSATGAFQIERTLKALEPILKRRIKRRYLMTRFDKRRRMASEVLRLLQEKFGVEVCRTCITEDVKIAESPAHKMPVSEYAPACRGASDYEALTEELLADGLLECRVSA